MMSVTSRGTSGDSTDLMVLGDVWNELEVHVVFAVEYADGDRAEGDAQHQSLECHFCWTQ